MYYSVLLFFLFFLSSTYGKIAPPLPKIDKTKVNTSKLKKKPEVTLSKSPKPLWRLCYKSLCFLSGVGVIFLLLVLQDFFLGYANLSGVVIHQILNSKTKNFNKGLLVNLSHPILAVGVLTHKTGSGSLQSYLSSFLKNARLTKNISSNTTLEVKPGNFPGTSESHFLQLCYSAILPSNILKFFYRVDKKIKGCTALNYIKVLDKHHHLSLEKSKKKEVYLYLDKYTSGLFFPFLGKLLSLLNKQVVTKCYIIFRNPVHQLWSHAWAREQTFGRDPGYKSNYSAFKMKQKLMKEVLAFKSSHPYFSHLIKHPIKDHPTTRKTHLLRLEKKVLRLYQDGLYSRQSPLAVHPIFEACTYHGWLLFKKNYVSSLLLENQLKVLFFDTLIDKPEMTIKKLVCWILYGEAAVFSDEIYDCEQQMDQALSKKVPFPQKNAEAKGHHLDKELKFFLSAYYQPCNLALKNSLIAKNKSLVLSGHLLPSWLKNA